MRESESFRAAGQKSAREQTDGVEGATAITEFASYLENSARLEQCHGASWNSPLCKNAVVESTQYQFLLSHFLRNKSNDKDALDVFWHRLERTAREAHATENLKALRRSALSQVAVLKTLERLGYTPAIAHPHEDAFDAIDVWADDNAAVQIKGAKHADIAVEETDTLEFPGIESNIGGVERHFNTRFTEEKFKKFSVKVEKYNKKYQKNIRGYFIVVPENNFSFITGEPDEEFVETLRSKLAKEKENGLI